jgi:serine-type D-Ala-D-Ala carboxypeptidase/endopeptidase
MRRLLLVSVLVACGSSAPRPPVAPEAPEGDPQGAHRARVTAHVQPLVDGELVAGIVVGLYDAGKPEIYGFGKGPGSKPPDGRTLFEIGSVTKVYTGLLLADAVQRKEVELDTPITELLPPGVTAPVHDGTVITLHQLATHSSGLPRLPPSLVAADRSPDPYARYGEDDLFRDLVATRLEHAPGEQIGYSNYGAGLLGHLLGRRIGGGYAEAMQTRILAPLGLADTYLVVPAAAKPWLFGPWREKGNATRPAPTRT